MSQSYAVDHGQPSSLREELSGEGSTGNQFADHDGRPTVASLFGVLGPQEALLPYDPDAVCRAVLADIDEPLHDVEPARMAELTKRSAGLEFPPEAVTRTSVRLRNEYVTNDIVVLLHLMQAHAELIDEDVVAVKQYVPSDSCYTTTDTNQIFIMVRILRERTERAMKHLGRTLKGVITRSKTTAKSLFNGNQQ